MRGVVAFTGVRLDLNHGRVVRGSETEDLTARETEALRFLVDRPGTVVTREQLERDVWGFKPSVVSEAVPVCMRRLRQKIERDPSDPKILVTVRGVGWSIVPPDPPPPEAPAAVTTRFVGRDAEIAQVGAAFAAGARLVTLVGPPGVGKSRLASELAPGLAWRTVWVDLSAAERPQELDAFVADALGVAADGDPPVVVPRTLQAAGPLVLVLDECERLAGETGSRVAGWLGSAPQLRVLATSRRPLELAWEQRVPIGPLATDDAIALFVDRARLGDPSFEGDPERLAEIVARVDGLPLAIELAAAAVGLVGVQGLARLLATSPLDALSTSESAGIGPILERSLELLVAVDRDALRSLAVIEAPFTHDDAVRILAAEGAVALRRLRSLVDQGLLQVVSTSTGARYRLYTVIRERMRRDLDPSDPAWTRHAACFARFADPGGLDRLLVDRGERHLLRAASPDLAAIVARNGDPDTVARCAVALLWRLRFEGPTEGLALATRMSGLPCSTPLRIELGLREAKIRFAAADFRGAIDCVDRTLSIGVESAESRVDLWLTRSSASRMIEPEQGARDLAHAEADAPRFGRLHASWLAQSASLVFADRPRFRELLLEATRVARQQADWVAEAGFWAKLAWNAIDNGDWREAARYLRNAQGLVREDELGVSVRTHVSLALAALCSARGLLEEAGEHVARAVEEDLHTGSSLWWLTRGEAAILAALAGDLPRGEALLHELVEEMVDRLIPTPFVVPLRIQLAEWHHGRGDLTGARNLLDDGWEGLRVGSRVKRLQLHALLDAEDGDTLGAKRNLDEAERVGLLLPHRVRHQAVTSLVASLAGRNAVAQRALDEGRDLARPLELTDRAPLMRWLERAAVSLGEPSRRASSER